MLKRTKIWMAVFVMMFVMLSPSALAHAAELSGETIEVPEDGNNHTVVAFGTSIAMVYPNGKMEIIANNPSGRSSCITGTIRVCTKCTVLNSSDISNADEHIHGDDFIAVIFFHNIFAPEFQCRISARIRLAFSDHADYNKK